MTCSWVMLCINTCIRMHQSTWNTIIDVKNHFEEVCLQQNQPNRAGHVGNYVQISFWCVLAATLPFRIFDNWTIWTFYTILHSRFNMAEIAWYKKKLNENARFRSIILHTTESVAMPATLKIIIIYLLMSKRYLPQHRSNSENRSTID